MQKSITKAISVNGVLVNLSSLQEGNNTDISIGGTTISSDTIMKIECPVNQSINGLDIEANGQSIQDFNISCSEALPLEIIRSGIDLSNKRINTVHSVE